LCNDTFLGLELTQGENHIILEYHAKGLVGGIVVTFLTIAVFVGIVFICNIKLRKL